MQKLQREAGATAEEAAYLLAEKKFGNELRELEEWVKAAWLAGVMLVLLSWMPAQATAAASNAGDGRWVNPISDVCWKCLFPMTLGNIQLAAGPQKDTNNPASPIQICPYGVFYRIGLAIGFWEPMAMVDVTREPGVMTQDDLSKRFLNVATGFKPNS